MGTQTNKDLLNQDLSGSATDYTNEQFIKMCNRGGEYGYYCSFGAYYKYQLFELKNPIPQPPNGKNIYFGVLGLRKKPNKGKAKNSDVGALSLLYAEFDGKDFNDPKYTTKQWLKLPQSERDRCIKLAWEHIKSLPLKPSVINHSGGGYHCYWFLQDPIILNDKNWQEYNELLHKWVAFVGGDNGAKDLSRVLRVPGTINSKYNVKVKYVYANFDWLYELDDLAKLLPVDEATTTINKVTKSNNGKVKSNTKEKYNNSFTDTLSFCLDCMAKISPERVESYDQWIEVGLALTSLDEVGLQLWDEWSKKSDKYRSGECSAKWETFQEKEDERTEEDKRLSLGSLKHWSEEDNPGAIKKAPKHALPKHYKTALEQLGYSFKLNEVNDDIMVNGIAMTDIIKNIICYMLRNNNYLNERNAELAMSFDANEHRYHPIIEYLGSLQWDGKDHISKLCSYFEDKQNVFSLWMKRWLIGAVAKVMAYPRGQQNRTLVLDGPQNIGKSYYVRWLCSPLPGYHVEMSINPDDKDADIRLMSKWIWEVSELGSTTRKSDREMLKAFLSKENVTVRKSYGHFDTVKPPLSNFIGTVNNDVGFLNDPTGYRRFMACTLTKIDRNYSKEVDINQVWGQAVALFKSGEAWILEGDEYNLAEQINTSYEVENPLIQYLFKYFDIDPKQTEWVMPATDILDILRSNNVGPKDIHWLSQQVSSALNKLNVDKNRRRIEGSNPVTVRIGIKQKNGNTPFDE